MAVRYAALAPADAKKNVIASIKVRVTPFSEPSMRPVTASSAPEMMYVLAIIVTRPRVSNSGDRTGGPMKLLAAKTAMS